MTGVDHSDQASRSWAIASLAAMVLVFIGLRLLTGVSGSPERWDEIYITAPMFDIIEHGWTVQTAIDFQETKGPALIWPYAFVGDWLGGSLNDLRLVSGLFFVLSAVPLILLAWRCGMRRIDLFLVTACLILLPHEVVYGQLVMGEGSFIFGVICMLLAAVWGLGDWRRAGHPVAGPLLFGLLVAILLHSRIHAVAWAGAVCLVAWQRDGIRSWPWWIAALLAGLLRIPLWSRWGGLVSSDYSNLHGLGFRLEPIVYLGAALVPLTGIFLLVWIARYRHCTWWFLCPLGAAWGLILSMIAMPDLAIPSILELDVMHDRYQGIIATAVTMVAGEGAGRSVLLGVCCMLGFASLGGLGALALQEPADDGFTSIARIQFWVLVSGISLYAFTRGFVFDRYLVVWGACLPLLWVRYLPRWLLALQCLGLLVIMIRMISNWLM